MIIAKSQFIKFLIRVLNEKLTFMQEFQQQNKRKDFFKMLDDIISGKVERVIISYKDRLSRVGYELFYYLFKKYNCEIIVMSEVGSKKLDSEEIFEEIISLLHCYSMRLYSKRKGQKIKESLKE